MKSASPMLKPVMRTLFILSIIVALAVGLVYWKREEWLPWIASATEEDTGPPVAVVEIRDIRQEIQSAGDISAYRMMEIKSEVGGAISQLYVEPGDEVKRGDKLLQIDDTELQIEIQRSKTELEGRRLQLQQELQDVERVNALAQRELISDEEVEKQKLELSIAENEFQKAKNDLELVEDRLDKTLIRAPIEGTILDVLVEEGQVVVASASVNAGTPLMNLADLSRKIITCHVNQVDIANVKEGQEVSFTVSSMPDEQMVGQVTSVAPVATVVRNVKGFTVEVLVTEDNGELRPGMTAEVDFEVAEVKGALSLPVAAVFRNREDNEVVYLRGEGDRIEEKEVKVGITNFDYAELLSGVQEGDEALLTRPEDLENTDAGQRS